MDKNIYNSPYEISLWDDLNAWEILKDKNVLPEIYFSVQDADAAVEQLKEQSPESTYEIRHFFKEDKIAIIGSDKMTAPQMVFNPTLTINVNGQLGLTFSLYYRYFDNEIQDFVDNPFVPYLFNERKVKVFYKNEWYDFIIKEVQENSDNYTFTYSCLGLFVNELSKTGFDLEFDPELDNNQGTIIELGNVVVAGTDWKIAPIGDGENDSDLIEQTINEPLYFYQLKNDNDFDELANFIANESLKLVQQNKDDNWTGDFHSLFNYNRPLYFFYSDLCENSDNEESKEIKFLYRGEDDGYEVDTNYLITNASTFSIKPNLIKIKDNGIDLFLPSANGQMRLSLTFEPNMRGSKLISKQRTKFIKDIDKYVYLFKDKETNKEIYGYYNTNYLTSASVENIITNGSKFVNTSGWAGILLGDAGHTKPPIIDSQPYPKITEIQTSLSEYLENNRLYPTLTADNGIEGIQPNQVVYCSTIKDNLLKLKEFVQGDKFVFRLRAGYGEITDKGVLHDYSNEANKPPFQIKVASYNNYSTYNETQLRFKLGEKYYYKKTAEDGIGFTYTLLTWKSKAGLVNPADPINYYYKKREQDGSYYICYTNWISETDEEKTKVQLDSAGNPYLFKISATNQISSPNDVFIPGLSYHLDEIIFDSTDPSTTWTIENDDDLDFDKSTLKFRTAILTCKKSISYSALYSKSNQWGIFLIPDTNLIKPFYEKTLDTNIRPDKTYFKFENGQYIKVEAPTVVDIKNYYEVNSKVYIQDVEFFNYIAKSETNLAPVLLGEAPTSTIQDVWYLYDPTEQPELQSINDVIYCWKGNQKEIPEKYEKITNAGFEKIRSITISESNRFNIIQELCETFECWAKFIVEHDPDTGEILYDENHIQKKKIAFKKYIGKDNYAGFHYGINLNQITRTLNSETIVTKTIVKDNSNEHANNGFCSIARGNENYIKDNFVLNFDYYINQGLINKNIFINDLYLNTNNYLGYYTGLRKLNTERDGLAEKRVQLAKAIMELTSQEKVYEKAYHSALDAYNLARNNLKLYCGIDYENFNEYVLTTDLVRDRSKTYYVKNADGTYSYAFTEEDINNEFEYELDPNIKYYEKVNVKHYIKTNDSRPQADKQYFYITENAFSTSALEAISENVYDTTLDLSAGDGKKYYKATLADLTQKFEVGTDYYRYTETYKKIDYADMIHNQYYYEKDENGNFVEYYYRGFRPGVHTYYEKIVSYQKVNTATAPEDGIKYYTKQVVNGQTTFVLANLTTFIDGRDYYEESEIDKYRQIFVNKISDKNTYYLYDEATNTYKELIRSESMKRADYYERLFTDTIKSYIAKVGVYDYNAKANLALWTQAKNDLDNKQKEFDSFGERLKEITTQKETLDQKFYEKYSRFIQEGSWIDENYVDDTLYYLDAVSVAHDSAFPQTTYNINVVELSELEGFEPFLFNVGDKTYIEDTEFFGWQEDGITPYKEEVVISAVSWNLDDPTQNSITVQNFKTQWEDLFQRITATTQSLQYHTGDYSRASNSFNTNGTLNSETLQNTFFENSFIIENARNQSVVIDERGITITDLAKASNILQLNSSGLAISNDGGVNWTLGITANGINASAITTGYLNTQEVIIGDKINPTFRWDKEGINAYAHSGAYFNANKFVRFDQFGLYGINNAGNEGFNPLIETEEWVIDTDKVAKYLKPVIGEEKIQAVADFSLTWEGLQFRSQERDASYISISSKNDFQVISQAQERVKIGELDNNLFGLRLTNEQGYTTLKTTDKGELILSGYMEINPSYSDYVIPYQSRVILGNRGRYEPRYSDTEFSLTTDTQKQEHPYYKLVEKDGYFYYVEVEEADWGEAENPNPSEMGFYEPNIKYQFSKIFSVFNYDENADSAYQRLDEEDPILYITDDGYLFAQNAEIQGRIQATEGYLGNQNVIINKAGISIYKSDDTFKSDPVFYIDESGNVVFKGKLEGATGTFSGDLKVLRLIVKKNQNEMILSSTNTYAEITQPTTLEEAYGYYYEPKAETSYSGTGSYETLKDLALFLKPESGEDNRILNDYWFFDKKPLYQKGFYSSTFFNSNQKLGFFIDPETGAIIANQIRLGSANLTERLTLGSLTGTPAYIYNPDNYENKVIESGALIIYNDGRATFGNTLTLKKDYAQFGLITVDGNKSTISGINPYISGVNAWTIGVDQDSGGFGRFNQLTANALNVETAVFDTASARLSGGINIFKNGVLIESVSRIGNRPGYYLIKCKDSTALTNVALDDVVFLTKENISISERYSNGMYGVITDIYQDEKSGYFEILSTNALATLDFDFALILGKKTNTNELKEWIIGVNATARDIDTLGLRKNSISLASIRKEDGKLKFTDEVIVGQIPLKVIDPITYATSEETTSGLYATSVFLTGTLTTRYNSLTDQKYAGINTLSSIPFMIERIRDNDTSPIVFWAGAESTNFEDIQKAPFQISSNGSLYASQGYFTGSIITDTTIEASKIIAATIFGREDGKALTIQDADIGIDFNDNEGKTIFQVARDHFYINKDVNKITIPSIHLTNPESAFKDNSIYIDSSNIYFGNILEKVAGSHTEDELKNTFYLESDKSDYFNWAIKFDNKTDELQFTYHNLTLAKMAKEGLTTTENFYVNKNVHYSDKAILAQRLNKDKSVVGYDLFIE